MARKTYINTMQIHRERVAAREKAKREMDERERHRRLLMEACGAIAGAPSTVEECAAIARRALKDCGYLESEPHPFNAPNIAVSGGLPATGKTYTERAGSVRKSQ